MHIFTLDASFDRANILLEFSGPFSWPWIDTKTGLGSHFDPNKWIEFAQKFSAGLISIVGVGIQGFYLYII